MHNNTIRITVVGGGLAGAEASYQIARQKINVDLYEMRPLKQTPAHNTGKFSELVCSNSLKSNYLDNASGILKEEMRRLGSLTIEAADNTGVPAGKALAVDRTKFSDYITKTLENNPYINVIRKEFYNLQSSLKSPV
ncbi:MAG: methylenetetrahydrofolate--tRNA-(uracil(54)-C(5))-methyltransferase (FADH(2)-oxidizing) TrmFO, partial [Candidatus Dadabacteria bacterium]|nr:methylenetetrahydrofolate--tRNA-(uracil(54)-C(5))-methyltransferase (FADH(2)-oxidizing) TrmFO [Candidatus Dadabacteria bacterium]NIT14228.1 methylenetetrahydrofolate--tRNA-(uracil(54)-C(5))-methyltransferase (FADH(2)-oxidizing) TrmFO [Candidatus Dadabacteria bacterium]